MTHPAPLVPADLDVRDLDGFMLNVERMLASELWALSTGDEFKAAFALWMRAWKQLPGGSLPDDDRVLAAFSGAGKSWPKVRDMALRGFVKCSDGRLYHRVLCEDVKRAAQKKAERRERTKAATDARKKNRETQRDDQRDVVRDDDRNDTQEWNLTTTQRQGQGQGQGDLRKETALAPNAPEPPAPAPAGKPAAKRGTRLPADWTLTVALAREGAAAREAAGLPPLTEVELRAEGASFRDYWHAKSGMDATKTDWTATWRNWCRKAKSGARPAALPIRESTSKSAEELGL